VTFALDIGEDAFGVCRVLATHRADLEPAAGVRVRYRIISGSMRFENGTAEASVESDRTGLASIGASFAEIGSAVVVADLGNDAAGPMVFFRAHTQGATHTIGLFSAPTFPVDPGVVTVRIVALDHHGSPVSDANLIFEAASGPASSVSGEVRELGRGEYEGTFRTTESGTWEVLAQDASTKATAHRCIHVLPGEPDHITFVGETDPRMEAPYGSLDLRARLEDAFGNALDPHRLACQISGQPVLAKALVQEEARFPVGFTGYGTVDVVVRDTESTVAESITVPFAAVWLSDPGPVFVGTAFRTTVFALPPRDRPAQHATIVIEFDGDAARFVGIERIDTPGLSFSVAPTVEGNHLVLILDSDNAVNARDYPDGIPVCTVEWSCQTAESVCFSCEGRMSPSTPKWERCVDQKTALNSCLCTNVIYPPGDTTARAAGIAAANEVQGIFSSSANIALCCPVLRVEVHDCRISNADWLTIANAIGTDGSGHPTVTANAQYASIRDSGFCQRANCINLYVHDSRQRAGAWRD
jgi:hypothetical protein